MDKPFEVGEWVWVWPIQKWAKIISVVERNGLVRVEVEKYETWFSGDISRNPVIPPKPKKIVTKEAIPYIDYLNIVAHARACGQFLPGLEVFEVPRWAKNIRCTYDIEE